MYLIDEYNTSCRCYNYEGKNEKFRKRLNSRPLKKGATKERDVNGLLRCETCKSLWNRDKNASLNMNKIMRAVMNKTERPTYLKRPEDDSNGTTSVVCLEKNQDATFQ